MRFNLGMYPVVENKLNAVTFNIGKNVTITAHLHAPCKIAPGQLVTLIAEIDDAYFGQTRLD